MKRMMLAAACLAVFPALAAPLQLLTENNPPFNFKEGNEVKGTATQAVQEIMKKAGLAPAIEVLAWDAAYAKLQSTANTCLFSTARLENREKLFKWYGPIAQNNWALYALPGFTKKVETARDARFFKIGGVKNDAKVDYLRAEGASSIREAAKDSDNPARLAKPTTDPDYIELWVTGAATARTVAAAAGVKEIKEVLVLKKQDLFLACNPRTDKATLDKLDAAMKAAGK